MYRNIHGWSYHRYSGPGATAGGLYIVNNTFAVPNPDKQGQIVIAGVTNNLVIENNVFYQPNTTGIWFDAADGGTWSGALVANNLSTNAVSWPSVAGLTSVGNIENTDPKFGNAAGFEFHQAVGRPAGEAGTPVVTRPKERGLPTRP